MKYKILFTLAILVAWLQGFAQGDISNLNGSYEKLQEGDLLFFYSSVNNPITDVTNGIGNLNIEHVAIFHRDGKKAFALEATHKGVVLTPINSIINQNKADSIETHIIAGRLTDTTSVATSVAQAMKYIGRPYDFYFDPGDSAIYCSELVQISYKRKNGSLIFNPIPMCFHDKTGCVTEYWKKYYSRVGRNVPEGEPGSNPGDISRNKNIKIRYYLF
jgi:hypothetical protein